MKEVDKSLSHFCLGFYVRAIAALVIAGAVLKLAASTQIL